MWLWVPRLRILKPTSKHPGMDSTRTKSLPASHWSCKVFLQLSRSPSSLLGPEHFVGKQYRHRLDIDLLLSKCNAPPAWRTIFILFFKKKKKTFRLMQTYSCHFTSPFSVHFTSSTWKFGIFGGSSSIFLANVCEWPMTWRPLERAVAASRRMWNDFVYWHPINLSCDTW